MSSKCLLSGFKRFQIWCPVMFIEGDVYLLYPWYKYFFRTWTNDREKCEMKIRTRWSRHSFSSHTCRLASEEESCSMSMIIGKSSSIHFLISRPLTWQGRHRRNNQNWTYLITCPTFCEWDLLISKGLGLGNYYLVHSFTLKWLVIPQPLCEEHLCLSIFHIFPMLFLFVWRKYLHYLIQSLRVTEFKSDT